MEVQRQTGAQVGVGRAGRIVVQESHLVVPVSFRLPIGDILRVLVDAVEIDAQPQVQRRRAHGLHCPRGVGRRAHESVNALQIIASLLLGLSGVGTQLRHMEGKRIRAADGFLMLEGNVQEVAGAVQADVHIRRPRRGQRGLNILRVAPAIGSELVHQVLEGVGIVKELGQAPRKNGQIVAVGSLLGFQIAQVGRHLVQRSHHLVEGEVAQLGSRVQQVAVLRQGAVEIHGHGVGRRVVGHRGVGVARHTRPQETHTQGAPVPAIAGIGAIVGEGQEDINIIRHAKGAILRDGKGKARRLHGRVGMHHLTHAGVGRVVHGVGVLVGVGRRVGGVDALASIRRQVVHRQVVIAHLGTVAFVNIKRNHQIRVHLPVGARQVNEAQVGVGGQGGILLQRGRHRAIQRHVAHEEGSQRRGGGIHAVGKGMVRLVVHLQEAQHLDIAAVGRRKHHPFPFGRRRVKHDGVAGVGVIDDFGVAVAIQRAGIGEIDGVGRLVEVENVGRRQRPAKPRICQGGLHVGNQVVNGAVVCRGCGRQGHGVIVGLPSAAARLHHPHDEPGVAAQHITLVGQRRRQRHVTRANHAGAAVPGRGKAQLGKAALGGVIAATFIVAPRQREAGDGIGVCTTGQNLNAVWHLPVRPPRGDITAQPSGLKRSIQFTDQHVQPGGMILRVVQNRVSLILSGLRVGIPAGIEGNVSRKRPIRGIHRHGEHRPVVMSGVAVGVQGAVDLPGNRYAIQFGGIVGGVHHPLNEERLAVQRRHGGDVRPQHGPIGHLPQVDAKGKVEGQRPRHRRAALGGQVLQQVAGASQVVRSVNRRVHREGKGDLPVRDGVAEFLARRIIFPGKVRIAHRPFEFVGQFHSIGESRRAAIRTAARTTVRVVFQILPPKGNGFLTTGVVGVAGLVVKRIEQFTLEHRPVVDQLPQHRRGQMVLMPVGVGNGHPPHKGNGNIQERRP